MIYLLPTVCMHTTQVDTGLYTKPISILLVGIYPWDIIHHNTEVMSYDLQRNRLTNYSTSLLSVLENRD